MNTQEQIWSAVYACVWCDESSVSRNAYYSPLHPDEKKQRIARIASVASDNAVKSYSTMVLEE